SPPLRVARKPVGWVARGAPPRSCRDRDSLASAGLLRFLDLEVPRGRTGRPPVGSELVNLVRTMALADPLWGAPRIHGELLKLGSTSRSAPLPGSCRVGRSPALSDLAHIPR